MAKFKNDSLDLETGEKIDFNDADTISMGYDGAELYLNSTLSGVRAVQPYHMVRYDQLTEASGFLSDHGNLIGRGDDDHTQYLLANGTRQLTGTWDYGTYSVSGTGNIYASTAIVNTLTINGSSDNLVIESDGGSFAVYRTGVGGYTTWMKNSNYPQWMFGNPTSASGGYVDVENNAPLYLNTLHTGGTVVVNNLRPMSATTNVGTSGVPFNIIYSNYLYGDGSNITNINHTQLLNKGTNTHSGIDSHIADTSIHFDKIDQLSDVMASGIYAPKAGDYLGYSSSAQQWLPMTLSGIEAPAVQVRRNNSVYTITTVTGSVPWLLKDLENYPTTIKWDSVDTERIQVYKGGLYAIAYTLNPNDTSTDDFAIWAETVSGSVSTVIPGSYVVTDGETGGTRRTQIGQTFITYLNAGTYVRLRTAIVVGTGTRTFYYATMSVWSLNTTGLEGKQGLTGPAGAGSNVNVYDDGTPESGTPFNIFNFIGDGVTVSGSTTLSGMVNILIDGGTASKSLMVRRLSYFNVPQYTYTNVPFEYTDVESDTSVLEHLLVEEPEKVYIRKTGVYALFFGWSFEVVNDVSADLNAYARIYKNGIETIPGSEMTVGTHYSGSANFSESAPLTRMLLAYLNAGDSLTLQLKWDNLVQATSPTVRNNSNMIFGLYKVESGPPGAIGPAGAGSSIHAYQHGALISGGPWTGLNFLHATVSGNPTISGVADVAIGINTDACQATYTGTAVSVTAAQGWYTFTYNVTDIQTNPAKIKHDLAGDPTKIIVYETGVYHVGFYTVGDAAADSTCYFRIIKNGVLEGNVEAYFDSAGTGGTFHCDYLLTCSGGDYLQVQVDPISSTTIFSLSTMYVYRVGNGRDGRDGIDGQSIVGPQGPMGPAGSGSTLNVYKSSATVSGTPFQALNFLGDNITLSGSTTVSGAVDISVSSSAFGSNYIYTSDETLSSYTGSAAWQTKLTLSGTNLVIGKTYRVGWYGELSGNNAATNGPFCRMYRPASNTEIGINAYSLSKDYADDNNQFDSFSGVYSFTATSGTHTFQLQYACSAARTGDTVYFRRARIEMWRIS